MKTALIIHDLVIPTSIGVHDWEKKLKQELVFNLELQYDAQKAMQTDDFKFALDYTQIGLIVNQLCAQKHFDLIEHLAGAILDEIKPLCTAGKLTIFKKDVIPNAKGVSFLCSW